MKEAARTFNYLSENNLLNYEDFQQHLSDVDASVKAADQRITQINFKIDINNGNVQKASSYLSTLQNIITSYTGKTFMDFPKENNVILPEDE